MIKWLKKIYKRVSPSYQMYVRLKDEIERVSNVYENLNNNLWMVNKQILEFFDIKKDYEKQSIYIKNIEEKLRELENIMQSPHQFITNKQYEELLNGEYFKKAILKYMVEEGNNVCETSYIKTIYHKLKELETVTLLPFITNRIDMTIIQMQLEDLKNRFKKEFIILTDLDSIPGNWNIISLDEISNYSNTPNIMVVLVYNKDWLAIEALKEVKKYQLKYLSITNSVPMARFFHTHRETWETLQKEWENNPIDHYFCPVDFENIFQAILATKELDGDYVEIGTFKGASARATLRFLRNIDLKRTTYFLDTYEGFTYDEAKSAKDSFWENTHTDTSIEAVRDYLKEFPEANLIKNNIITDELPEDIKKITVCNIDVDMYDAVKFALYKVKDKIVQNGIIIAEDYGHTSLLIGAQKAVQEFLEDYGDEFTTFYFNSGQMFLIKK